MLLNLRELGLTAALQVGVSVVRIRVSDFGLTETRNLKPRPEIL
jgi:hypothetical protein